MPGRRSGRGYTEIGKELSVNELLSSLGIDRRCQPPDDQTAPASVHGDSREGLIDDHPGLAKTGLRILQLACGAVQHNDVAIFRHVRIISHGDAMCPPGCYIHKFF
jgi:hypothetical protein